MQGVKENIRMSLQELEAMATIRPVQTERGRVRMGCGFHGSDKQRSLDVNLESGRFHCYQCGVWGYLKDLGKSSEPAQRATGRVTPRPVAPAPARVDGGSRVGEGQRQGVSQEKQAGARSRVDVQALWQWSRRQLEGSPGAEYLATRCVSLDLAEIYSVGFCPKGKWPGRGQARRHDRVVFPLKAPGGRLMGLYSRAVDPAYPRHKVAPREAHDVIGAKGLFNPEALVSDTLFLTEGVFDALAMLASGYAHTAALGGTDGLQWAWLRRVRRIYLCLDGDEAGQEKAVSMAREAALRGIRAYVVQPGTYAEYSEPSEEYEAKGTVTLKSCEDCGSPVHIVRADRCPDCDEAICPACLFCTVRCPVVRGPEENS